jgi:predicted RNA-binding protein with PIN domain
MPVHIIIDGYNLIRQSAELKKIDKNDLQLGREALIDRLAAYKRIKGHLITVVFDGSAQFSHFSSTQQEKGIRITYSKYGETADAVIKRMAAQDREKALIVSSDNEVARCCASAGAAVISAAEFEEKMNMAAMMDIKGEAMESGDENEWSATTKKKGQGKKLPKKARRNFKKLTKL